MHQTFAVNNRSVNYNFIRNRRTSILSILRSIVSEEEWRVKWARRKKKFVSSGISRCAHGRRCIGNVMLILRGTACRTVGAFQESLASPAALTMIRPAARRWRRYRAPRIYRGDRPIYHIPIPPPPFTDVSRPLYLASLYFASPPTFLHEGPRSLASVTVALRTLHQYVNALR